MKTILLVLVGLVAAGVAIVWLVGIGPAHHTKNVFIVEATKSVPEDARAEAHTAIGHGVGDLKRGDDLVVVPLTGDAATEASGKVLRFRISTKRKAYDADLRETRAKIQTALDEMRGAAAAKPFLHTDLLGSLRLAAEEKPNGANGEEFTLAVLSDMIQDTTDINFMTHPALANEASARKFADGLMAKHQTMWTGARIFLGQLRSDDLKKLKPGRREAIRAFWLEYFRAGGAAEVVWATDGVGELADFLRRVKGAIE